TDWPHWTRFSSVVQHQQLGRDGSEGQEFRLTDNLMCEMGVLGPAYDSADLWVQTTPHVDSFKVEIGSCSSIVQPAVAEMLLDKLCATLSIFASIEVGNSPHLWELLARDGPPIIPIKSSIVEQVWSKVLPDADAIPWNTPYFDIWGDEIAPARFLEEYAEYGLYFDMEDILENPTKQAQMLLASRAQSDKQRGGRTSPRVDPPPVPTRPRRAATASLDGSAQSATATTNSRGFWILDPSANKSSRKSSRVGSSRAGSTVGTSPMLVASPRMGLAVGALPPPRRKNTMPTVMSATSPMSPPAPGSLPRRATAGYPYYQTPGAGTPPMSPPTSGYSSSASSSAVGSPPYHHHHHQRPSWAAADKGASTASNRSYASLSNSPPLMPGESVSQIPSIPSSTAASSAVSAATSATSTSSARRQSALRPLKLPEYAAQMSASPAASTTGSSSGGGSVAGGDGERSSKLRRKKVASFPVGLGVAQAHGTPVLNGRW
ncbi:hypothetical protein VTH82DRAFT_6902, partial [Thermothelomyces myriococcoides]